MGIMRSHAGDGDDIQRSKTVSLRLVRVVRWSILCVATLMRVHHWTWFQLLVLNNVGPNIAVPQRTGIDCRTPPPPSLPVLEDMLKHPAVQRASRALDLHLKKGLAEGRYDSVTLAIVTPSGPIYEGFQGPLKANETDTEKRGHVDRHSIYRLASVSKLFTMVETLILQERGVLKLDDPVTRFLPNFNYTAFDAYDPDERCPTPHTCSKEPITLRQLASHMSGIRHDLPAGEATDWPEGLKGGGPPPTNDLPFPNATVALESIASTRLTVRPYTFPIYSNTGFSVLGACNVKANRAYGSDPTPSTHEELLRRDVLDPLGLNGTSFLVTDSNVAHITIPSIGSDQATMDFLDWSNPSGGQMSSLSDLTKLMRALLDCDKQSSLLSSYTMREWLRPIYAFWDDYSEVGVMWEIVTQKNSFGRTQRIYQKYGVLEGYYSGFSIHPESSFGVVVLTSGPTFQTESLNRLAFSLFQPAIDQIIGEQISLLYEGTWISEELGRRSETVLKYYAEGSLWIERLILNGTDALAVLGEGTRVRRAALWWMGNEQFRISIASPAFGGACIGQWNALDEYGQIDGWPINLLRFAGPLQQRVLMVPSLALSMERR